MPSTRDKMSGNQRYKANRNNNYDMQRDFSGSFDSIPGPVDVNGMKFERSGHYGIGTSGYAGEATPDPLLDHTKGIRDNTLPNYGRKDL